MLKLLLLLTLFGFLQISQADGESTVEDVLGSQEFARFVHKGTSKAREDLCTYRDQHLSQLKPKAFNRFYRLRDTNAALGNENSSLFEILDAALKALVIAERDKRTLILPERITEFYEYRLLELMYPTLESRLVISLDEVEKFGGNSQNVAVITESQLSQAFGDDETKYLIYRKSFFQRLLPHKEYLRLIDLYTFNSFKHKHFVCVADSKADEEMVEKMISLFELSRPSKLKFLLIEDSFNKRKDPSVVVADRSVDDEICGEQSDALCEFVRLELCSRANSFIGVSTGDSADFSLLVTIFRSFRQLRSGIYNPNVRDFSYDTPTYEWVKTWYDPVKYFPTACKNYDKIKANRVAPQHYNYDSSPWY